MKKLLTFLFLSIFWIDFSQASMVEHKEAPHFEKNLSLESGLYLAVSIFDVLNDNCKESFFKKLKCNIEKKMEWRQTAKRECTDRSDNAENSFTAKKIYKNCMKEYGF